MILELKRTPFSLDQTFLRINFNYHPQILINLSENNSSFLPLTPHLPPSSRNSKFISGTILCRQSGLLDQ